MSDFDDFLKESHELVVEQVRKQYSREVLEHWLHPTNPYAMDRPDGHAELAGSCGDNMEIFLRIRDGRVVEASFMTEGCITSIVSGSMAVQLAMGRTLAEVRSISQDDILEGLGGLPGDSEHCALLAADTVRAAVDDYLRSRREPWRKLYGSR
jgi:nitrogen fixation NifU-like protein